MILLDDWTFFSKVYNIVGGHGFFNLRRFFGGRSFFLVNVDFVQRLRKCRLCFSEFAQSLSQAAPDFGELAWSEDYQPDD